MKRIAILYTAQYSGAIEGLPRLYPSIQAMQDDLQMPTLLIDIGGACEADVWHCAATGGRSTYIVLDAMGYHAAYTEDMDAGDLFKLEQITTMGIVNERRFWRVPASLIGDDGIVIGSEPTPALTLCIVAQAQAQTMLHNRILSLQGVEQGQVGQVVIELHPEPQIVSQTVQALQPASRPDATIQATIDFVLDEARQYQDRQG